LNLNTSSKSTFLTYFLARRSRLLPCTIHSFHELMEFFLQTHKSTGTVSFSEMALFYWIFFGSTSWLWIWHQGTIYNLHIFSSFALYIHLMCLGSFICMFIKVKEWYKFLGLLFSTKFFLVPLLGHGFDTRGLFITCTYLFPFHYTFFPWVRGVLCASSQMYSNGFIFWDVFCVLNFLRESSLNWSVFLAFTHVCFSIELYIVFMSSRSSFCEFIKVLEWFHFGDGFSLLNIFWFYYLVMDVTLGDSL